MENILVSALEGLIGGTIAIIILKAKYFWRLFDSSVYNCPICLEEGTGFHVHLLPCGHAFHNHCLNIYAFSGSCKYGFMKCPLCRQTYYMECEFTKVNLEKLVRE